MPRPGLALEVFWLGLTEAPIYLWAGLFFLLGAALLSRLRLGLRARIAVSLLLSAVVTGEATAVLFRYRPFSRYIPFYILLAGLFTITALALRRPPPQPRPGLWAWILDRSVLYAAFPAAIAVYVYAYVANRGLYPNLHLASLQIAHHLLGLGLWRLFLGTRLPSLRRRSALFGLGAVAVLALSGTVAKETDMLKGGLPYFRAFSILGQSHVVFHPFRSEDEGEPAPLIPIEREEALELFDEFSAMPELPVDLDLSEFNVLLIASEATRFDQTSLADPALATTPSLERLAKDAFVFTRAYSPSSGTVHSMSGFLAMSYPSMLRLETWNKAWHGRLHDDEPILSEHFSAADYETFWVGHNYEDCFDLSIKGFKRGWDLIKLQSSATNTVANDRRVGDVALRTLKEVAKGDRPFFGWVFFESPHGRYHKHYPDMPGDTGFDRYRQEIRYTDEQIGRLLDDLEKRKLLEKTIIVYFSDHGEEFREHGGTRHKSTVYSESTRVPLIIRIPGVPGRTIDEPTSTLYVPPWLLLHSAESLREAAIDQIVRVFAPMMADTDGGVAIELCGHDRMMASLVYPEYKFNYDFIAKRYEAFDIRNDPLEQEDLFGRDLEITELAIQQLDRYRTVRRDRRRYILLPDYELPDPEEEEAPKGKPLPAAANPAKRVGKPLPPPPPAAAKAAPKAIGKLSKPADEAKTPSKKPSAQGSDNKLPAEGSSAKAPPKSSSAKAPPKSSSTKATAEDSTKAPPKSSSAKATAEDSAKAPPKSSSAKATAEDSTRAPPESSSAKAPKRPSATAR